MSWIMCFCISVILMIVSIVFSIITSNGKKLHVNSGKLLSPIHIMFVGLILASLFMFIPIYISEYQLSGLRIFEAVFLSIHNMIRLFFVDGELGFIKDSIIEDNTDAQLMHGVFGDVYFIYASLLFIGSSVTTVGFILSFFKSLTARLKLRFSRKDKIYLFSALNENSFILAKDIHSHEKNSMIVFFDVYEATDDDNPVDVLIKEAQHLGFICFKDDILNFNFTKSKKSAELHVFIISNDESDNTYKALKLFQIYKNRANTCFYVFSSQIESEVLLAKADSGRILVRRINDIRSFIYYELYNNGTKLFENALTVGDEKVISVVIVGMGNYGTEMLKALTWYCQMDGYHLQINAFDEDENALNRFRATCPELLDSSHNGNFSDDGEAQYVINIHPGTKIDTLFFYQALRDIKQISYVFVALENDMENIRTATNLRMVFERMGIHPTIQSIIKSTAKKEALENATNYSNQSYDIQYIGDTESLYTKHVIINSDLEAEALNRHLRWGQEDDFWKFDYNHNSSMASALHSKLKKMLGVPGAEALPDQRTEEEKVALRKLEHRRWNAYMRTEGYVFSGSLDKKSRNNLGKMHHCLVTFDLLSLEEQQKDDY